MSRLIELQVENVMGVRAVTLRTDGAHLFEVVGKNGQGKTSVLDAFEMLVGGAKSIPAKPVRDGEGRARIVGEFDDMIVTRTINTSGKSQLKIEDREGKTYASPQSLLDSFIHRISFDPFAFSKAKPEELERTLRDLVGLDFSTLDAERAELFAERTGINRDVKQLEGELAGVPERVEAPGEEVSVAEIASALAEAEATERRIEACNAEVRRCAEAAESARARIAELQAKLEACEQEGEAAAFEAAMLQADPPNVAAIRERLATVDATNRAVRANKQRADLEARLYEAQCDSSTLTDRLGEIDAEKRKALEEATYPLPGLCLTDEGVTLDGIPFRQANQAARLRAGVAIGLALNPRIRVLLVREGAFLDEDGLALLERTAAEHEALVIVERVGRHVEGVGVVLEDGGVIAAVGAAQQEIAS